MSGVGAASAQVLDQVGVASAIEIEAAGATITKMPTAVSMTVKSGAVAASAREVEEDVALAQEVDQVGADGPTDVT